ncbi:MAG: hypothetical protein ACRDC6_12565 [Shewanella sp.]
MKLIILKRECSKENHGGMSAFDASQDWLEPFLPSEGLGTAALFGCQG